jgi:transposase
VRWSRLGVFNKIFAELARKAGKPSRLIIDATHLKAPRTAASLLKRACSPTYQADQGRPELEAARRVRWPGTPRHHAAQRRQDDWFRQALAERGITACIPSKSNRKNPIEHDRVLYRQRHKIENMFGRLKDWRRIHTRYDRCAHTFMSAICIAAAVIFWI